MQRDASIPREKMIHRVLLGVEAGLGDRSDGARSREKVGETDCTASAKVRSILETHQSLRDHPQNAFRAWSINRRENAMLSAGTVTRFELAQRAAETDAD
jgi:hypothetical protein